MEIIGKEKVLEKFCKEIHSEAIVTYNSLFIKFHNQLKRYDEDEKLDFIQSQKNETRKYLEESFFENVFPVITNDESKVFNALKNYIKNHFPILSQVEGWEYNEKVKKGDYLAVMNKNIIISVHPSFFLGKPYFNFCDLDSFSELPKYIAYNWLNIELKRLQKEGDKKNDYSDLLTALNEYLTGISANEFTNIIVHHLISPGTPKAKWEGSKADAIRFADFISMKIRNFNNCFYLTDGKKLARNNKDKDGTDSPINDILKSHLLK